jgi:hypothetical protein
MKKKAQAAIAELLKALRALPGDKIATLVVESGQQTFDLNQDGTIGYTSGHERVFVQMLEEGLSTGGALIIRQFLTIKVERTMPNGVKRWIPKKNVYGIFLGQGTWRPLSGVEVKAASTTDAESGAPIGEESDVYYRDFPVSAR